MDITKLVTALLSEMKAISSSETVIGTPIRVGEATVVPVNRLTLGFGVGAGASRGTRHEHDGASGTTALGGGVTIQPMGFIVVDAAGRAHLLSLDAAKESPLLRAVEMLPEVASKLAASGERLLEKTSAPKS